MKEYLRFTKKELLGLIVLMIAILLFAVFPFVDTTKKDRLSNEKNNTLPIDTIHPTEPPSVNEQAETGQAQITYDRHNRPNTPSAPAIKATLFNFDPNTLDENGWRQLGLRKRTIRTIINYRNKGGRFRKTEDLLKIYGLRKEAFERLRPYIVIAAQPRHAPSFSASAVRIYPRKAQQPIDINTADTSAYKALYGIGSKLAARIVHYREKLGGFYSIRQVGETYGVPDSTFQKIRPYLLLHEPRIKKIDINTASYEELNAHPYISSKLAYLIVKQRRATPLTSSEALQALVAQTKDVFEKLEPYIRMEATEK
ncbi:helix-hairpin-helix domain-containing protein [Niabella aurantiaca]|uniref:helix-hairpin-helix domain-containing protein n=1 Tax=Niabella aurantiaca TaxID=379900 RepID=UPI00037FEC83|nr:helix-hairpin-helix domain-containing protein [Niabella aurantiaca]